MTTQHFDFDQSYSTAEQSDKLWALNLQQDSAGLDSPGQWKELASGPRLQGLAMVAWDDTVVRPGGFTARNAEGDEHDLHSQATVSRYDVAGNRWVDLTPLPEPRSSFAAAVMGGRVYVMGGWNMAGSVSTRTDVYDPATDRWHRRRASSTAVPLRFFKKLAGSNYSASVSAASSSGLLATICGCSFSSSSAAMAFR